ncbi:hypothetical protein PM3016_2622 [Paenibacillus mucilaginosus 3016]|uniref:Uncharacterized protein n=2 Tax=Paenibacillus mucilaginosus TaxID=61624 RepID=H6NF95_9BACL|nr:hypothetical protein PM3016_2622 [Paenibacillus mucilaginosus 3016]AFH61682.1 hypothetical protein B2K_13300 [Paenibacillus mucilaginosus K02]WFA18206.1 hypothetical protein ERY13_13465 [Paenibacillus mucilaginosus]
MLQAKGREGWRLEHGRTIAGLRQGLQLGQAEQGSICQEPLFALSVGPCRHRAGGHQAFASTSG